MATKATEKPKLPEPGKLPDAPQPKLGWDAVGKAYEGRKKPDGLGRDWQ